jgi:hypothetical protein
MPKNTNEQSQGLIVKEYLKRYQSVSSRRLARIIINEIPGLFKTEDLARNCIRYYRGATGNVNRSKLNIETYIPKINIPESLDDDYSPFILHLDECPVIIGADAHIPYHNQDAIEIFIERAKAMRAKTMILLGDWLDFYMISRFMRDPRACSVADELALFKSIIEIIRKQLPNIRIIYKYGNHEERFDNYLMQNAPELFKIDRMHLDALIDDMHLGLEIVKDKRVIRLGQLNLIHGHEYTFSIANPVNPARGLYLRAKKPAACAHFHQTSSHIENSINGDVVACWSIGCMCGLNPLYMPLNKWNLGFAEAYQDEDMFAVQNRSIINYKLL